MRHATCPSPRMKLSLNLLLHTFAARLAGAFSFLLQSLRRLRSCAADEPSGLFLWGEHSHGGLTRQYKLYLPPGIDAACAAPAPLVVMLHGCGQHPDDFAAGTGMNGLAARQGFVVLYPAQSKEANALYCWNWFKHNHQRRDRGEPALIASLTRAVMDRHAIDPSKVYIAGLSAGGAMAAIMAAEYPDLYAAVGVHSGLAPGTAASAIEAVGAMKGGSAMTALTWFARPRMRPLGVPTIVFHGDQDKTVHPANGDQVIKARLAGQEAGTEATLPSEELGRSPRGRRFTRKVYRDAQGRTLGEHWLVHGAGHAWSGGHPKATYTDARGPDASQLMLRFFFGREASRPQPRWRAMLPFAALR
jgi:poly(hydroxyalkanoate) depolymerase family esterase